MTTKTEFQYIDKPNYGTRRCAYIRKAVQLDNKDDQFPSKKFQSVRRTSTSKTVLDSFSRIGLCLNKIKFSVLPKESISKVCFVVVSNFENSNESLGVAPVNDAYLFAFIHYKLGYKIVYLYNPDKSRFIKSLKYFLAYTTSTLTIYYSGPDSYSKISQINHGIQFSYQEFITDTEIGKLIGQNKNPIQKIMIFSDCTTGGSIISLKALKSAKRANSPDIVSFSVNKKDLMPKEKRMSHGIFTYYFCKLIRQFPDSSVSKMTELLNASMRRFGLTFTPIVTDDDLLSRQMISGADSVFKVAPASNQ